jgi:hypothetical protein
MTETNTHADTARLVRESFRGVDVMPPRAPTFWRAAERLADSLGWILPELHGLMDLDQADDGEAWITGLAARIDTRLLQQAEIQANDGMLWYLHEGRRRLTKQQRMALLVHVQELTGMEQSPAEWLGERLKLAAMTPKGCG